MWIFAREYSLKCEYLLQNQYLLQNKYLLQSKYSICQYEKMFKQIFDLRWIGASTCICFASNLTGWDLHWFFKISVSDCVNSLTLFCLCEAALLPCLVWGLIFLKLWSRKISKNTYSTTWVYWLSMNFVKAVKLTNSQQNQFKIFFQMNRV